MPGTGQGYRDRPRKEITIYQQICQSLFMDIGLGQVNNNNISTNLSEPNHGYRVRASKKDITNKMLLPMQGIMYKGNYKESYLL